LKTALTFGSRGIGWVTKNGREQLDNSNEIAMGFTGESFYVHIFDRRSRSVIGGNVGGGIDHRCDLLALTESQPSA
jgi:hypothetical protein